MHTQNTSVGAVASLVSSSNITFSASITISALDNTTILNDIVTMSNITVNPIRALRDYYESSSPANTETTAIINYTLCSPNKEFVKYFYYKMYINYID